MCVIHSNIYVFFQCTFKVTMTLLHDFFSFVYSLLLLYFFSLQFSFTGIFKFAKDTRTHHDILRKVYICMLRKLFSFIRQYESNKIYKYLFSYYDFCALTSLKVLSVWCVPRTIYSWPIKKLVFSAFTCLLFLFILFTALCLSRLLFVSYSLLSVFLNV